MANVLEARDLLISHLYNNWTTTDVSWPNKTYNPSTDISFIKPFFNGGFAKDLEIGIGGADLNAFSFFIDIFTPINTGDRQGLIYAEDLRTLYQSFDEESISLEAASIKQLGENEGFYQTRFSIPVKIIYYPT